jgi:hypothetical protein
MKLIFTFFILIFCKSISAQQKSFVINNVKFITVPKKEKSEYNRTDKFVNIYYWQKGKRKFLCKFYTYQYGADCNNEFSDIGTIEIKNDSLILKTHFKQKRQDPIPDWEKTVYKVYKNGKVLLVYNKTFQNGAWNAVR